MWKGAIELAVPRRFGNSSTERNSTLMTYHGSEQGYRAHCPYGLMKTVAKSGKSRKEAGVPKMIVLIWEFDPDNDCEASERIRRVMQEKLGRY